MAHDLERKLDGGVQSRRMGTSGIVGRKQLGLWMAGLGAAAWAPDHARALERFEIADAVPAAASQWYYPRVAEGSQYGALMSFGASSVLEGTDDCLTRVTPDGRSADRRRIPRSSWFAVRGGTSRRTRA